MHYGKYFLKWNISQLGKTAKLTIHEISKVVCKKTMSKTHAFITSLCCMKPAHNSKRMMRKQDCVKFRRHIARQSLFENDFADFSDEVLGGNPDFVKPLVAFPISNISYSDDV